MPQVVVRGSGIGTIPLGSGETLLFGRAPLAVLDPAPVPGRTVLTLPDCASHVSRLVGELTVGTDRAVLTWLGAGTAQLAGLFDAPGGARRVSLRRAMSAPLDDGENQLILLLGWNNDRGDLVDLVLNIDVLPSSADQSASPPSSTGPDGTTTGPYLTRHGREWFVALALAEPWLAGNDDYPRPPSNREIFERIRGWHGYTWNLHRPQRVDEAIRVVSALAFGVQDDPFLATHEGRLQNVRFAVGLRAAEMRLVTTEDLAEVERAARNRKLPPGHSSPGASTPS
jgi:hypothetical protein